jgi:hypothetical protein
MSEAAALSAQTAAGSIRVPISALARIRRIGYVVLGLQLAGFLVWSTIMYSRFALTADAVLDPQAWFLIAHGHLDPADYGLPAAWRDHSEFMLWPLALLYWVWPHTVTLLWVQDLCLVGAEVVAFVWLCEIAQRHEREAAWLAGAGLVLLAANPWLWWTVSWDFHMQVVAVLFVTLLARDLLNGRRRAWIWVLPLVACGDVATTYIAGVGVGAALVSRRRRRAGLTLTCIAVVVVVIITLAGGNHGSSIQAAYGYLAGGRAGSSPPSLAALVAGSVRHPLTALQALWAKHADLWANLAPSGVIGLGFPLLLPLILVVTLANQLHPGLNFSEPIFQSVPVYVLLPVGTVAVLGWIARRHPRMALLLAGAVAVQTLGWAAVWGPATPGEWLRVPSAASATLARISARIPASAEVIASQGVVGGFATRTAVYSTGTHPVRGATWFIITPTAGIETGTTASAMALIGELAGALHATLVTHANGVWAFRWRPPPGVHGITAPGESSPLPAWAAPITPGEAGRPVLSGRAETWHMTATGEKGYVANGLAWQEPPGRYTAAVRLSATGPVNVEVWDDTGQKLLTRHRIPATAGIQSVTLPVDATTHYQGHNYSGWGPFQAEFARPLPGERLEVRVWSPGGERVDVYGATLAGLGTSAASSHRRVTGEGGDRHGRCHRHCQP